MIYGETSTEFCILASCDAKYLYDHAKGLVSSCALAKNNVHIHVTNPTDKEHEHIEYLRKGYNIMYPEGNFRYSYDLMDITNYNSNERVTFYQCNRFLVADQVVKSDVLIVDIDCFLIHHIDPLDGDVGIYFRDPKGEDWEREGTYVAAGVLYCKYDHFDFLLKVKDIINSNKKIHLLDQVAIYRAYKELDKDYINLDDTFMDWQFRPTSKIWTGKGTLKMWSVPYTQKHKDFKKKFPEKEDYEKGTPTST